MLLLAVIQDCHLETWGENALKVFVKKHNVQKWQFNPAEYCCNAGGVITYIGLGN